MIFWFWFFGRFSGLEPWRVEWPSTLHAVCVTISNDWVYTRARWGNILLGHICVRDLTWNSTRRRTGYFLLCSQCLTKLVTSTGLSAMAAIAFPSSAAGVHSIPKRNQIKIECSSTWKRVKENRSKHAKKYNESNLTRGKKNSGIDCEAWRTAS